MIGRVWLTISGLACQHVSGTAAAAAAAVQSVRVEDGRAGVDCPDTLYWPYLPGEPAGALRAEMAYFAGCLAKGSRPTVVTPQEARAAVEAVSSAEKSARTGKIVRL